MEPSAIVETYLTAQNAGDIDRCMELIAGEAVFDAGRGRYEGSEQIRSLLNMLAGRSSRTEILESQTEGDTVRGVWAQADDDGRRLGMDWVRLESEVTVREGKIAALRARPTAESLAALRAAGEGRRDLTPKARRALDQPPA